MEKIQEDVYKISGEGNVYLILRPEPTIIDTGNPYDKERIKKEINKIIPTEKIKKVLLTHLHYDHAGNPEIFPNAEIYASIEELKDFRKNPKHFFFGNLSQITKNILEKNTKPLPRKVSGLEVLKVPGHTRGSVAFIDKKRKLLFSGDTLFFNGIGRTDFPNSVPENMDGSLKKLIDLVKNEKYLLLPGHDY